MKQDELQSLQASFEDVYGQKVMRLTEMKTAQVCYVETAADRYVLKLFQDEQLLHWQEKCVTQLLAKNTKGLLPFIRNRHNEYANPFHDQWYAVLPFIPGKRLNPYNITEVLHCVHLLAHFHQHSSGIYGKSQVIPFRSKTLIKWKRKQQHFFKSILHLTKAPFSTPRNELIQKLAPDCLKWSEIALEHISDAHMTHLEEQAQWERQLAHLDVVHHNFLSLAGEGYYLIDYDLFDYAPPILDLIQLLKDVLPCHRWSFRVGIHLLRTYEKYMPAGIQFLELLPAMLIFPYDIFREWNGLIDQEAGFHPEKTYHFLKREAQHWPERQKFVDHCLAMLK